MTTWSRWLARSSRPQSITSGWHMPRCVTRPLRTTWNTQRLRSPVISNQSPSTAREAVMIERYEELVRENKRHKAQLQTFRQSHYQGQAALARSAIAGEIKHGPGGVRVALTSEGLSLPAGTLLVAAGGDACLITNRRMEPQDKGDQP